MNLLNGRWLAALALVVCLASILSTASARAGSLYDMDGFLDEPHPFADGAPAPTSWGATMRDGATATSGSAADDAGGIRYTGSDEEVPGSGSSEGGMDASVGHDTGRADDGWMGILSEMRTGSMVHDFGPFSSRKEDGYNANFEILFVSPDFLDAIWSPRPHIGASINTSGDTSQVYFGLSYQWTFWGNVFAGFSLGGAFHDGETERVSQPGKKELGCNPLFRESVELGWHIAEHHNLSLMLDHISNAKLCDTNEGLESFGVRYGYKF